MARGFEVGKLDRGAPSPSVPNRVSTHACGDDVRQTSTPRDRETHSKCHAGATDSAPPAARRLRAIQTPGPPELLSPAQVAAQFGVCRATIYRLAAAGQIEHVRIGAQIRIPRGALTAYLARRRGASVVQ